MPLVAPLDQVHLWVRLPYFGVGGAGRGDQCCIDDPFLLHRHASSTEMGFDGLNDLLVHPRLLQLAVHGQDRAL